MVKLKVYGFLALYKMTQVSIWLMFVWALTWLCAISVGYGQEIRHQDGTHLFPGDVIAGSLTTSTGGSVTFTTVTATDITAESLTLSETVESPLAAGTGANGADSLTVTAQDGQSVTSGVGDSAGDGGGVRLTGGVGGSGNSGTDIGGNGGDVVLTAGVAGSGGGSDGVDGVVQLISTGGITLTGSSTDLTGGTVINGGFAFQHQTANLTADDTAITSARTIYRMASDDATPANRTFTIPNPGQIGQIKILLWNDTDSGQLLDSGNVDLQGGNWEPSDVGDSMTLIAISTSLWVELSTTDY